jgi:hypothetical protein
MDENKLQGIARIQAKFTPDMEGFAEAYVDRAWGGPVGWGASAGLKIRF